MKSNERKLNRAQKLLTAEQARKLPPLYATDGQGDAAIAHVKYFCGAFTWYVTEYDPQTGRMFGLVDNVSMRDQMPAGELGYFTVDELCTAKSRCELRTPNGNGNRSFYVPVERDIHWAPKTLGEIRDEINPDRRIRREDAEEIEAANWQQLADQRGEEITQLKTALTEAQTAAEQNRRACKIWQQRHDEQCEAGASALDERNSALRRIAELEAELSAARAVATVTPPAAATAEPATTPTDPQPPAEPAPPRRTHGTPRAVAIATGRAITPPRKPETEDDIRRIIAAVHC